MIISKSDLTVQAKSKKPHNSLISPSSVYLIVIFLDHVCINWWHWHYINKKTHFDVWFNKHGHWWNKNTSAKIGHSSDHCQTSWYQSDTKYSDQIKFGLVKFDNINNSSFFHFIAGKTLKMITRYVVCSIILDRL